MRLLNGKTVAKKIFSNVEKQLKRLPKRSNGPKLMVVLVGNDRASRAYIAVKKKRAKALGIKFEYRHYRTNLSERKLCVEIAKLNKSPGVRGIVIQLPLPAKYNRQRILDCINPNLDVDGLTSANQKKISSGQEAFIPPTPAAILSVIQHYKINLKKKRILLVGAGELVGKPLAGILKRKGLNFFVATRGSKNFLSLAKTADVLISGVGKPGLISGSMIKPGAAVIDAGTSFLKIKGKKKLVGDIDFASVSKKAGSLTPVPGGIGPVTVAMLYKNLLDSCQKMVE